MLSSFINEANCNSNIEVLLKKAGYTGNNLSNRKYKCTVKGIHRIKDIFKALYITKTIDSKFLRYVFNLTEYQLFDICFNISTGGNYMRVYLDAWRCQYDTIYNPKSEKEKVIVEKFLKYGSVIVRESIDELPISMHKVFSRLYRDDGECNSIAYVAKECGVSELTVKNYKSRLLSKIRENTRINSNTECNSLNRHSSVLISDLDFSPRVLVNLRKINVTTYNQMINKTINELLEPLTMGKRGIIEILSKVIDLESIDSNYSNVSGDVKDIRLSDLVATSPGCIVYIRDILSNKR